MLAWTIVLMLGVAVCVLLDFLRFMKSELDLANSAHLRCRMALRESLGKGTQLQRRVYDLEEDNAYLERHQEPLILNGYTYIGYDIHQQNKADLSQLWLVCKN